MNGESKLVYDMLSKMKPSQMTERERQLLDEYIGEQEVEEAIVDMKKPKRDDTCPRCGEKSAYKLGESYWCDVCYTVVMPSVEDQMLRKIWQFVDLWLKHGHTEDEMRNIDKLFREESPIWVKDMVERYDRRRKEGR